MGMKMKKRIILGFLLFAAAALFAQTAEKLEELLNTPVLSYEQAAWFILEASDIWDVSSVSASPYEAFIVAKEHNWLPKKAGPDDKARLDGISLLLMKSFGLKGGLGYSLFKNPHYAYRELVYRDIIQGRIDPAVPVSGDMLVYMGGRILSELEDTDWSPVVSIKPIGLTRQDRQQMQILADQISAELGPRQDEGTSVRITDEGVTISLSNIQFAADSTVLPEDGKLKLQEIARILIALPNRRLVVAGHTALVGNIFEQRRISLARAESVRDYLVSLGVRDADEITAVGYGALRPIGDNKTPEGMALNRRVEIIILENLQ